MLSEATRQRIEALMKRYPKPRSALIPALVLAQAEVGYLALEAVADVAGVFGLPPNEVYEVASFYTLLYKRPVGRHVVQVCTNISCLLRDCDSILDHLKGRLGIVPGETTPDGRVTVLEVECLASCGTAPVAQIDADYHENLTPEKLDRILDSLR